MKQKKVPLRQCVGCREMKEKRCLVRIVKSPEGEITADFTGKSPGRGAYICKSVPCLERAKKSKALSRAFSTQIPDQVFTKIEEALSD